MKAKDIPKISNQKEVILSTSKDLAGWINSVSFPIYSQYYMASYTAVVYFIILRKWAQKKQKLLVFNIHLFVLLRNVCVCVYVS